MSDDWHSIPEKELLKDLETSEKGLDQKEAYERLKAYGENEIPEAKRESVFLLFLKQFHSVMIYILFIAAGISYFFDHFIDVWVILIVIFIDASIGFIQEYQAEKSIKALKKMVVSYAKVYRNGDLQKVPATQLVYGDIILLEEGDRIPADARLLEIKNLRTVESSLTGESFPVDKQIKTLSEKTAISDMKNMVFMGTFVASGIAKCVVVATGQKTYIGSLAKDLEKIQNKPSHFEKRTNILAEQLGLVAIIGAIITFIIGYFFRGFAFLDMLLFTIATLVAAIPEGLPAVLAIALAIGSYRMSKRNALIRHLTATETLGVVTTIITDKTGTLTENTMNVEKIIIPGYSEISVTGESWNPQGNFFQDEKEIAPMENEQLKKLIRIASICNNARVIKDADKNKKYTIIGDPTEAALVVLSEKAGLKKSISQQEKIDDLPFNQDLKFRASLSSYINNKNLREIYIVGAPESVLKHSKYILKKNTKRPINDELKKEIHSNINSLSENGMRVLGLAYREVSEKTNSISNDDLDDMIFIGVVGIRDPPRLEVKDAIKRAKEAGIRVIMATGDHGGTALAVAREIRLVEEEEKRVLIGEELEGMSKMEFSRAVREVCVFARLTPQMKLKIAEELQKQGHIVAMTGDGVNDAPALKKADIGISMGIIGTDVARESSDIVLVDDNFASIINAIEEGRVVFMNTRQTSMFLISTNLSELVVILLTMLLKLPLPLLPTQILWLNLVTGGGLDVTIATEKDHNNVLKDKPLKPNENILTKKLMPLLIITSIAMISVSFFMFLFYLPQGIEKARTMVFAVLCCAEFFNVFNMRSLRKSIFSIGFFSNKWITVALVVSILQMLVVLYVAFFQNIFHFTSISIAELLLVIVVSSLVLVVGELYKLVSK